VRKASSSARVTRTLSTADSAAQTALSLHPGIDNNKSPEILTRSASPLQQSSDLAVLATIALRECRA